MTIIGFVVLLFVLIGLGMPIAFALLVTGALGLLTSLGLEQTISVLSGTAYRSAANPALAAIPLFILMAEFMNAGGMAREVFEAVRKWVGRMPGGLAITTVGAGAGFAAISGSSTASAATLASIALPEFKRTGYSVPTAAGIVAIAGTLSVMIPPSIAFIIYGLITDSSIGRLLIAGIVPGILTGVIYVIAILLRARFDPVGMPPGERYSWREKFAATRAVIGFVVIVTVIFVALYGGIATPNEVAAIGAFSSLVYLAATGRLSRAGFVSALTRTVKISTMIFLIIVGAMVFGYFLALSQAPQQLFEAITASGLPAWQVLGLILLIYLVLGFFMEQIAILLITLPMTFPIVTGLGYDPIWFGVIVVKLVEIGLISPPLGLNVFVVSATTGVPVAQVFRGTNYLLMFELLTLAILLAVPGLSTWLPSQMG